MNFKDIVDEVEVTEAWWQPFFEKHAKIQWRFLKSNDQKAQYIYIISTEDETKYQIKLNNNTEFIIDLQIKYWHNFQTAHKFFISKKYLFEAPELFIDGKPNDNIIIHQKYLAALEAYNFKDHSLEYNLSHTYFKLIGSDEKTRDDYEKALDYKVDINNYYNEMSNECNEDSNIIKQVFIENNFHQYFNFLENCNKNSLLSYYVILWKFNYYLLNVSKKHAEYIVNKISQLLINKINDFDFLLDIVTTMSAQIAILFYIKLQLNILTNQDVEFLTTFQYPILKPFLGRYTGIEHSFLLKKLNIDDKVNFDLIPSNFIIPQRNIIDVIANKNNFINFIEKIKITKKLVEFSFDKNKTNNNQLFIWINFDKFCTNSPRIVSKILKRILYYLNKNNNTLIIQRNPNKNYYGYKTHSAISVSADNEQYYMFRNKVTGQLRKEKYESSSLFNNINTKL